jgi:hypothetical protein
VSRPSASRNTKVIDFSGYGTDAQALWGDVCTICLRQESNGKLHEKLG